MSLFKFFKKEQQQVKQNKILLAMPIFKDNNTYQLYNVINNLKAFWKLEVTDIDGDDEAAAFKVNGELIALANISLQIPWGDIKGTAEYAYNWPSALKDLEGHTGHAIVSVMTSHKDVVDRFRILSKVLSSILMTSDAVAVYQGNQSLLIPRKQYLSYTEMLEENNIPVMIWIYIGLRESATGNSAYTYGLKDFEKSEIEIIDSKLSLEELLDFLYNISSYVIGNNVTLKGGQTVGLTADHKIPVILSKGRFIEGQSLKLEV